MISELILPFQQRRMMFPRLNSSNCNSLASSSWLKAGLLLATCFAIPWNGVANSQEPQKASKAPPQIDSSELKITFLANEGFLIKGGGKSILMDAFIKDEYYGYGNLPLDEYKNLVGGLSPFDGVQLALTSHVHLDHFQAPTATKFLQNNRGCEFVSTEQVTLKIKELKDANVQNQMTSVWPDQGVIQPLKINDISIKVFRLRHANPRNYKIQNLGFIVQLDGLKVLHVGDAESRLANFEGLKLPAQKIDVAILPYWMFGNKNLVSAQIAAREYVAAHIPTGQVKQIKKQFATLHPGVQVFETPLESRSFKFALITKFAPK